ncbi:MAG: hypothetical protein CO140_03335 [Candidatus Moranbacteria bacterium CG_4_9_14_3_um_filter_40_7]|nr:MAG: hypothetical protein COX31_03195 [Candidatus Moranbacteria bacterium CG23_combo_of_CG06-09_8_20_14_all_40_16]PIU80432.1 MAG: hypothetical protein COS71_03535 [Candidatus Moranbacteria bacterium CG06_land_8_20_14_3_00_40_12]PJA87625.1 MAG: hypothetical protein CO140_03335 [Candidatus Moranbacteria bacterium CG_4_9_14_3_um_filter_40_7]
MQFKLPKNTKEFFWTNHVIFKMKCYGLSTQKILNVIKKPERKEEGIVKNTIAVMQPVNPKIQNGKKIWKQEIWAMYQIRRARNSLATPSLAKPDKSQLSNPKNYNLKAKSLRIISAWRYPGVSPRKDPIPGAILAEIKGVI